jgi:FlaA1/EpsC-like NDP-sugar epimerase
MFTKLEIVSRWIIFTIDICLSLLALLFSVILQHNFIIDKINFVAFYKSVLLVIAVNSLVFYSVKTFAGIVRYTSAQDSFRILFSVILSSLILFFTNALIIVGSGSPVISNVAIVIYTLFSFLMLITYRIIVKYLLMYL